MCATARVVVTVLLLTFGGSARAADPLPRFTEEREAAALHFVRKHCPEQLPLLEELKKVNPALYELQVRQTFQVTELLADLQDDPKRSELELKLWIAENKALVLVAKLATPQEDARRAIEDQLRTLAKELVDLEVQSLEHRAEVLDREAASAREDLLKARDGRDRAARDRYEVLLEKARKKRGP